MNPRTLPKLLGSVFVFGLTACNGPAVDNSRVAALMDSVRYWRLRADSLNTALEALRREKRPANGDVETVLGPCERPRPYRNWPNAELNAAMVRYMGGDDDKTLQALIDEAACRT